ncbi:MAG: N-acyl homoserine lactonase family protein, partial [Sulfuricaulis sp.]|nr:N-acyl homoserine lactonase family protein [Sulfuricaulis sp.]
MTTPQYEVYAIRYASLERRRNENFIQHDPHDGPMPMDFFVWLLRSAERAILIDTGFNAATAATRNRTLLRCPIETLRTLGVDPDSIEDVVITHLHYDHAGNLAKLPNARFHVQDTEVSFATGRCMCYGPLRHAYSVEDVVELIRKVYRNHVVFHEGDADLAPGVQLLLIGGHTQGLQAVRVFTARGWVVLASDASHYYENMERDQPFPIVYNLADMLAGYRKVALAADSADHIVPGHDPEVLRRYPAWPGDEVGIACLHQPPLENPNRRAV